MSAGEIQQENQTKKTGKLTLKKTVRILWIVLSAGLLFFSAYIYAVNADLFGWFGSLPSYKSLENPKSDLSSVLYSADGVELGKYYRTNRSAVTFDELSPYLKQALVSTEDENFYQHSGISLKATLRVVVGVLSGSRRGGGSTLSQQLAKNLFGTRGELRGTLGQKSALLDKIIYKTKEWIVAIQLERNYTKQEILAMYLNTVFFGQNSYGIEAASQTYFNKPQHLLKIEEAAILAGIVQSPSAQNPKTSPKRAMKRRNEVFGQMLRNKKITNAQYDSLKQLPVAIDFNVKNHNHGMATYFRSTVGNFLRRWARENGYDLYAGGLKIYTTLDSRMQAYAEKAVKWHMPALQEKFDKHWEEGNPWIDEHNKEIKGFIEEEIKKTDVYKALKAKYKNDTAAINAELNKPKKMRVFSWNGEKDVVMSSMDSLRYYKKILQTGFIAMDPVSGHIKAWVGGINHKYFQYDHVMVGKRQPGSTFKPIVYAAAIDNGFSPCDKVTDQPYSYTMANGENWVPQNATGRYTNQDLTLRQAMARSVNSITAYVMNKVGPEEVVKYAKRLGIKSPLQAVPALALGVNDVSLYDMVGAYSTFINKGVHTKPKFLTRIEDKFGNVIHEFPPEKSEVLNEETAYLMTYMLRGTTEEIGGSAARLIPLSAGGLEIGGKTGTTQNASDGWFISVTKDLVCGAWTGGDNRAIRFRHWADGQGARTALPEVKNFLENVYGDSTLGYEKGIFPRPQTISRELNCDVLTSKAEEALRKAEEESLPDSLKTEEPKPVEVPEINEDDLNF